MHYKFRRLLVVIFFSLVFGGWLTTLSTTLIVPLFVLWLAIIWIVMNRPEVKADMSLEDRSALLRYDIGL